jgi:hypothetical protein
LSFFVDALVPGTLSSSFEAFFLGWMALLTAMMGYSNLAILDLVMTGVALRKLKYIFGTSLGSQSRLQDMVAFHPPSPKNLKTSSPLKKLSMATWTCSSKICLLLSFGSFGAPFTRG